MAQESPKPKIDVLVTKADELYTSMEEGQVLCDTELKIFLNQIVDYLESMGGQVDGIDYVNKTKNETGKQ